MIPFCPGACREPTFVQICGWIFVVACGPRRLDVYEDVQTTTGYTKITQQDVQQALETFDNDGE